MYRNSTLLCSQNNDEYNIYNLTNTMALNVSNETQLLMCEIFNQISLLEKKAEQYRI